MKVGLPPTAAAGLHEAVAALKGWNYVEHRPAGPTPSSVSSVGSCGASYDHALAESVIRLYETEVIRK